MSEARIEEADVFRVPKQHTPVDVLLADGKWHRCAVFLAARSSHHDGPERVSDLLGSGNEFLAAHDEETGRVAILGRAGICCVRVEPWAEASTETVGLPIEHAVAVTLSNGSSLQGVVSFAARPDQSRVIDWLNGEGDFFPLQELASVALINKRHVVRVELR